MRVVHENIKLLRIHDALKTPGHAAEGLKTAESFGIEAEAQSHGLHGQQVFGVVVAHEGRREFPLAALETGVQPQPGGSAGQDRAPHVAPRRALGGEAETDGIREHGRQTRAPRVVGAHGHDPAREGLAVLVKEEFGLGLEIGFHVVMVIEMVLRKVGEDGPAEVHARHAILIESVGGNLHKGHLHACRAHAPKHGVHVEAVRGGHGRVLAVPGPAVGNSAEDARPLPRRSEKVIEQVGGRRLAVGPGHADHGERQGGRAVAGPGQKAERLTRIGAVHHFGLAAGPGVLGTADHIGRAPAHSVRNEVSAVGAAAGQSHEHAAGRHLARIDAQRKPLRGHLRFQ